MTNKTRKYLEKRRANKAYWAKRSIEKNDRLISDAETVAKELEKGYASASKLIEQEIKKIFRGFENAFDISEVEAKRLVALSNGKAPSKAIMQAINMIADPDKRKQMLAEVSSGAYKYRIDRLDKLAKQAEEMSKNLYARELQTDGAFLASEMDKAYKHTIFDLQQGTGVSGAFEQLPESRIKQVINTKWSGKHFSSRIWGNTQILADTLRQNMIESFITGEGEREAAARISERFGVASFRARALIRTENTYVTGQAELEAYRNSAVSEYEYASLDDNRRSLVCERLDGKVFLVKKATPGVNYPPMHPFCRSSTMAVLPSEEDLDKEWDTFLGDNVPQDMSFDEWLDGLEPTEDGKLVYTGRNADESDIGSSIKRTVKSAIKGEKIISYDELSETIRNNFETGLKNSTTEARLAIKHELDTLDVCVNDSSKARFFYDVDLVQIRSDDDADTLAHEIFHRIDKKHKVNKKNDLLSPLKNDWNALRAKAQGDVVTYLISEYPTAFTVKNSGKVVLRKEYRGISDIISGLTGDKVNLGYHHNAKYWGKKNALQKEAWAQFGRIMYNNNPEVQKMFKNIFTSFDKSAIIALKDVI